MQAPAFSFPIPSPGRRSALPEAWLGGTESGPYAGGGLANVRRILENECRPPWRVTATGSVDWTIRNHRNHFERIHSRYLRAER